VAWPGATLEGLKDAGIEILCAPAAEAVRIYNERSDGQQTVAAAVHLTC